MTDQSIGWRLPFAWLENNTVALLANWKDIGLVPLLCLFLFCSLSLSLFTHSSTHFTFLHIDTQTHLKTPTVHYFKQGHLRYTDTVTKMDSPVFKTPSSLALNYAITSKKWLQAPAHIQMHTGYTNRLPCNNNAMIYFDGMQQPYAKKSNDEVSSKIGVFGLWQAVMTHTVCSEM